MRKVKLKIYCDTNIYSRPFDQILNSRIHLEAMACLKIFNLAYNNKIYLTSSDILKFEILNASPEKQLLIGPLLKLCQKHIKQTNTIKDLALLINKDANLAPRDSLHLASAIIGKINFFITCDQKILRKNKNHLFNSIIILNPIELIYQYENQ
tara:strand:- start:2913 stop:3371 length:459 start_codon:yes stop_codon:yes gene_type:complete